MNTSASKLVVCRADEVGMGEAIKVETAGLTLAVYNVDGTFYVTDDHCTHGPGSLSEGFLDGEVIECNFHQGCFNVRTGAVVTPPCVVPIRIYPASVEDGTVYIQPSES